MLHELSCWMPCYRTVEYTGKRFERPGLQFPMHIKALAGVPRGRPSQALMAGGAVRLQVLQMLPIIDRAFS